MGQLYGAKIWSIKQPLEWLSIWDMTHHVCSEQYHNETKCQEGMVSISGQYHSEERRCGQLSTVQYTTQSKICLHHK